MLANGVAEYHEVDVDSDEFNELAMWQLDKTDD